MLRVARLLPTLVLASLLPAQATDPEALIATAERRLARGPDEDTVLLLWQAEALLVERPDSVTRSRSLQTVNTLLAKADPLDAQRRAARGDAAETLLEVALLYRRKAWFESAAELLAAAVRLDAARSQTELDLLARARGGQAGLPASQHTRGPRPLIEQLESRFQNGRWQVRDGTLHSPPLGDEPAVFYQSQLVHADARIAVDVLPGTGSAQIGLVFGAKDPGNCYVLEFWQDEGSAKVGLSLVQFDRFRVTDLSVVTGDHPLAGSGVRLLEIEVRGRRVRCLLDGALHLEGDCPAAPHGAVGFYVSGHSKTKKSIGYRNLTIGPLPESEPSPQQQQAAETTARRREVEAALTAARQHLERRQNEAAALLLRRARSTAVAIAGQETRDALLESVDTLLRQADTLEGRRSRGLSEAASRLSELAVAHAAADRLRCARQVLAWAADLDPLGQAAAVAAMDQRVAAWRAERERQLAAAPVDNVPLVQWFSRGARPLGDHDRIWSLDENGAEVSDLANDMAILVAAPENPAKGRVVVQVGLPAVNCFAGLGCGYRGRHEYLVCLVERQRDKITLVLRLWRNATWLELGEAALVQSGDEPPRWFEIELQFAPERLIARCGDVELKCDREDVTVRGRVLLMAGNRGFDPAVGRFRGFRPPD